MRIQPGVKLGRYEVLAHVGTGGMGEVYRARDTRLDKQVALKTIATAYADDPASNPRFERERRLTAALEHAHICRVLDAGEQDGIAYLAMEFLDGESLAERLARGPLPVGAAVGYAIEIADALEYAHRHGVVHRDLKPANVFLTRTGAKVLDFGLAKLRPGRAPGADARGDTVPLDVTQAGMLVGSAPYMAPERLEGYDADHRSDIFAFGALLYEMLSGRRAFAGTNSATLIAAILSHEPAPLNLLDPAAADLDWIVKKCLAKKPDERWQSMADVQIVLKRIAAGVARPQPKRPRRRAVLGAALLIPLVIAPVLGWLALNQAGGDSAGEPLAISINPPAAGSFTPTEGSEQSAQLALSPDGRSLAFVAAGPDGVARLWIRKFSSLAAIPVAGTEDAKYPFWSTNGRSIGFFTADAMRRVDLAGGPPRTIIVTKNGRGGTWNAADEILFAPSTTGTIMKVSANAGTATDATRLDESRGETSHRWPHFLPDGRRFLYYARFSREGQAHEGVYCTSLDGGTPTLVANTNAGAVFLPPDRVLVLADGTLVARTISSKDCLPHGDPIPVAERVGRSSNYYGAFSASTTGAIAYASNAMTSDLVWLDRAGRPVGTVASAEQHVDFRLSPDSHAVAIAKIDDGSDGSDIYVRDLDRNNNVRIASSRSTDASPVWSPDRKQILFRSNRERVHDLYIRNASGTGPEMPFQTGGAAKYPTSWSSNGRIAYHTRNSQTRWDIMIADAATRAAQPLTDSVFDEMQAHFSPDGKWVAYSSNDSGPYQVWVQQFPAGERRVVSASGGTDPHWRADGRELFYISDKGELTAVAVDLRGATIKLGAAQPLFTVRDAGPRAPYTSVYDVAPDGQRFLLRVPREDVRSTPLTVLLNWPLRAGE